MRNYFHKSTVKAVGIRTQSPHSQTLGIKMHRIVLAALCTAIIAAPAHADPIDDAFADWTGPDRPGCAVGIRQGGNAPDLRAYGMADLERAVPVTVDTVFESGSVAKQFTAAAVLMLVEDGRLSLGDDIRGYLPEMPDYGVPITIDHLLTHTSGLRDWSDLVGFNGWPRYSRVYSNTDALLIASRQRALNHPPGARFSYTNTGYNLLAVIVERATGKSLADFTRERIFAPLGMAHSGWRDDYRRIVANRAVGYVRDGDRFVLGLPMENAYGSGGMLTTLGDLLEWEEALDRGTLGRFVTSKLSEPARLDDGRRSAYGRGLVLGTYRGEREVFHNGGTNGYQAWAGRYPGQDLAIVMLCNGRTVGPDTQVRRIASLFVPPKPLDPLASPPAEELRSRPGLYVAEGPFEILRIETADGQLRTASGMALEYLAAGRYRLGSGELRFTPMGLERHLRDGEILPFTREVPASPAAHDLAQLAGRYVNDEVSGAFVLQVRGGKLFMTPIDRPDGSVPLEPLVRDGFIGPGYLVRVLRTPDGRVSGLSFRTARVYALDFVRADDPSLLR
ncbi:serine hydrolase [Luteimonas sp. BDR2-5]|uniref:serine hydrolase domain-containing protein n=1 Tax=Proluteimonas luteida TaxID=2878685 RepID=UPI001E35C679|nr:serine hydrolase domain-containing protein [Luteimonas sp. BDR2-5]MCD9026721.1 serine hydrolase [Luteimonas sp. BDR2-5]